MSCAVFTFIGGYAAYANKSNVWVAGALFSTSFILVIVAGFLAWRDKEKEVRELQAKLRILAESASIPPVQNIYFPAPPIPSKPEPLKHNVQFVGVEINQDFPIVRMCFRNIEKPGRPLGSFTSARLKVNYTLEASGEKVAEIFPAKWVAFDQDSIEIGFTTQCAVIAMHFKSGWEALTTTTLPADFGSDYRIEHTPLPSSRLKIFANLIGEDNISLEKPIEGVLTLGEDGNASFVQNIL